MANITAQMVKELRESTGAGMMDCKSALSETSGDMTAAHDWLRKKGLSKAAKKSGRVAAEGLIGVKVAGTKGVVVEVNSETDFVARNDLFQGLAGSCLLSLFELIVRNRQQFAPRRASSAVVGTVAQCHHPQEHLARQFSPSFVQAQVQLVRTFRQRTDSTAALQGSTRACPPFRIRPGAMSHIALSRRRNCLRPQPPADVRPQRAQARVRLNAAERDSDGCSAGAPTPPPG